MERKYALLVWNVPEQG